MRFSKMNGAGTVHAGAAGFPLSRRQVALGLGAALFSPAIIRTAHSQQNVIRFGASLSLTGSLSTESRFVKDGYDMYVRMANERGGINVGGVPHRVEITYYDDESNAQRATSLIDRLIVQDRVNFVLGPYSSGVTLAASTVTERHRTPMVAAHAASTPIYERGFRYLFAVLNSVDQYTINIIKIAAERGVKKVALVHENALFPNIGMQGAAAQATAAGLEVVYRSDYPSRPTDLSALLTAAWARQPDLLLVGGYSADMILLTRQAAELGVRPKMFGFLLGPTLPGFVESLKDSAEYVLEPTQWTSNMNWKDDLFGISSQDFATRFQREFGYIPDYHPPQSAASLIVYHKAIEAAKSLDPQRVRDAIAATDIMTFYGPIRFNEKGQNVAKGMGVVQIQNQRPVVVYPAANKEAELVFPIPRRN